MFHTICWALAPLIRSMTSACFGLINVIIHLTIKVADLLMVGCLVSWLVGWLTNLLPFCQPAPRRVDPQLFLFCKGEAMMFETFQDLPQHGRTQLVS